MIVALMDAILSMGIVLEINAIRFMEYVSGRDVTLYMISVLEIIALQFIMRAMGNIVSLETMFAMEISVKVDMRVMERNVRHVKEIAME